MRLLSYNIHTNHGPKIIHHAMIEQCQPRTIYIVANSMEYCKVILQTAKPFVENVSIEEDREGTWPYFSMVYLPGCPEKDHDP